VRFTSSPPDALANDRLVSAFTSPRRRPPRSTTIASARHSPARTLDRRQRFDIALRNLLERGSVYAVCPLCLEAPHVRCHRESPTGGVDGVNRCASGRRRGRRAALDSRREQGLGMTRGRVDNVWTRVDNSSPCPRVRRVDAWTTPLRVVHASTRSRTPSLTLSSPVKGCPRVDASGGTSRRRRGKAQLPLVARGRAPAGHGRDTRAPG
jgi:hypothetical protein